MEATGGVAPHQLGSEGMVNKVRRFSTGLLALVLILTSITPTHALMSESRIRQIQEALNKAGYTMEVNGKMGKETQGALSSFQRANGLTVTGRADRETLTKLGLKWGRTSEKAGSPAESRSPEPMHQ